MGDRALAITNLKLASATACRGNCAIYRLAEITARRTQEEPLLFTSAKLPIFEEAIAHYREALKLGLNGPQIRFNLGMALAMNGQREEARAELAEALRLKPDYAEAQRELQRLGAPNP